MTRVTIHEAKTQLSKLIKQALEGEEIIIARGVVTPDRHAATSCLAGVTTFRKNCPV